VITQNFAQILAKKKPLSVDSARHKARTDLSSISQMILDTVMTKARGDECKGKRMAQSALDHALLIPPLVDPVPHASLTLAELRAFRRRLPRLIQ
jgi:hypothetical protein